MRFLTKLTKNHRFRTPAGNVGIGFGHSDLVIDSLFWFGHWSFKSKHKRSRRSARNSLFSVAARKTHGAKSIFRPGTARPRPPHDARAKVFRYHPRPPRTAALRLAARPKVPSIPHLQPLFFDPKPKIRTYERCSRGLTSIGRVIKIK